jgi:hypothetical protein
VTPRAIGCMTLGAMVFVGIGLLAFSMAARPSGCPEAVQWAELAYRPVGSPAPSPDLGQAGGGQPVEIGSTFIGLGTRRVVAAPGTPASPSGEARPAVVALECGDGTWQTYRGGS